MNKVRKLLILTSLILFTSATYLYFKTLHEYKRDRNIEVIVIDKFKYHKSERGVGYYFKVKALSEVKDEAVLIEDHTFLRDSNTMTPGGAIKSKYITKIWMNGPVFHVPVDINDYIIQPIGTTMIFKVSQSKMNPNDNKDKLGKLFFILIVLGSMSFLFLTSLILLDKLFK